MTIPPNAARLDEDGSQFVGEIIITRVEDPSQGPQPLPEDIDLSYYISIQPFGVVYPEPVPISFPNIENFPPGAIMDFFALNHDTGQFEKIGEGAVSNDGRTVDSFGGIVQSNSWHGTVPQAPVSNMEGDGDQGEPMDKDPCENGACRISLTSGNLGEDHQLPSYYSLGKARTVNLSYNSQLADPRPIVRLSSTFGNFAPPPIGMSTQISVAGIEQGALLFSETNITRSSIPGQFETTRIATQINGSMFESGIYNYDMEVNCLFPISRRSEMVSGTVVIQNESDSFFGSGWTLNGLQRLYESSDGMILISEGDQTGLRFMPPADASPSGAQIYESANTDFSTLSRLADGSFSRRMKDGTIYNFGTDGFQTTMSDRNGNVTQYIYNGNGSLNRIIDPTGREYQFTYVGNRIRTISDPLNRTTTFVHDADGNLIKIIEPNGDERDFEYDANHLLTAQEDQRDNRKQYTYNAQNRIIGAELADGSTIGLTPSGVNGVIDSSGGEGVNRFNLAPRPTLSRDVQNLLVDQNGNLSMSQVDSNSAPIMKEDAVGRVTRFQRDEDSLPTETTRPNTSQITRNFDALGNPTLVREGFNGAEYRYNYDENSLVTQFINPRGNTTTISRDPQGNATQIVNQLGHTTAMQYDTRGLVTRSVSPNNLVTTYVYNDQALLETLTETPPAASPGNIRVTRYQYDAAGQMTQVITPDNITLDMVYDVKGR
ncbi:MAG: RHS repeat protein, partial [Gammaproteobacteria bacterium]|nr:RHS repeat protein [Gammaproteobacteria bacterium]